MKARVFGYARISTGKQNIERQIANIKRVNEDALIIAETFTGTTTNRPEWTKLLRRLRAGDTVIFDEVSRMSRDAAEGFEVYTKLFDKGVNLVFIKEPYINTDLYANTLQKTDISTGKSYLDEGLKIILMGLAEEQIRIAFEQAQKEIEYLHKRTSEGVRRAQAEGKQVGRKEGAKIETKKAKEQKAVILKHSKEFNGSLNDAECIKLTGLSRNTYYKYKREIKQGI